MKWWGDEYCLLCHRLLEPEISWHQVFLGADGDVICSVCKSQLKPLTGNRCRSCSRVLDGTHYKAGELCFDCLRWEEDPNWQGSLSKNVSLFHYNDFLKEVMARFKYRGDYVVVRAFKQELQKDWKKANFDYFVPIPLSRERLMERGFNQAEALIVEANYPVTNLLSRVHTEKQSKKSRAERIHLPQVFQIQTGTSDFIHGKKILLVDDIYTTGSTVRHAAKILCDHGAERVESFTLAR